MKTYWKATGSLPKFLTVFVHLLDQNGQIVAQLDRQSVLADTLQPGDVFMPVTVLICRPIYRRVHIASRLVYIPARPANACRSPAKTRRMAIVCCCSR